MIDSHNQHGPQNSKSRLKSSRRLIHPASFLDFYVSSTFFISQRNELNEYNGYLTHYKEANKVKTKLPPDKNSTH